MYLKSMLGSKHSLPLLHRKCGLRFVSSKHFLWVDGGVGGRKGEGTWQQMSPSSIWEAVKGSAGPEGKGFVQELQ